MNKTKPTEGKICINNSGMVTSYSMKINDYFVSSLDGKKVVLTDNISSVDCEEENEITISLNNNFCSKNKIVTIYYPNFSGTTIKKEYSLDNENWQEYKEPFALKENGMIYARISENNTVISSNMIEITSFDNEKIDDSAPVLYLSDINPKNSIEVDFRQSDNCSIDTSSIEYGISTSEDGEFSWQSDNVFNDLTQSTKYYIKTRANDTAGNGKVESKVSDITTSSYIVKMEQSSENYTESKTISLFSASENASVEYKIGESGEWNEYIEPFTIYKNGVLYVRIKNGEQYSEIISFEISTIVGDVEHLYDNGQNLGTKVSQSSACSNSYTTSYGTDGISFNYYDKVSNCTGWLSFASSSTIDFSKYDAIIVDFETLTFTGTGTTAALYVSGSSKYSWTFNSGSNVQLVLDVSDINTTASFTLAFTNRQESAGFFNPNYSVINSYRGTATGKIKSISLVRY